MRKSKPLNVQDLPLLNAFWLILLIATATIITAWYFELARGMVPCKLCLQQRFPYYAGIPLAALGLVLGAIAAPIRLMRIVLVLIGLIFLTGTGLGIYHSGVEWGFWLGPADCGGTIKAGPGNVGGLMSAIQATKVVSCSEAAWRLAGISMAGWNALVSLVLAGIAFGGAWPKK